ncbi:hypothetical protein [Psychromicrobium xiongbiense]|uniref:hypothetical protein n=1 Tax=Psychromicrobium xiongbiense TaxID=3051184 RepID=UPI002552C0DD|nr:hypothetical protein [Psychromicrobium sp. YIM S02556]
MTSSQPNRQPHPQQGPPAAIRRPAGVLDAEGSALSLVNAAQRGMSTARFVAEERRSALRWRNGMGWLIVPLLVAIVLGVIGYRVVNEGPSCGGQAMRPGDQCVNYRTGAATSTADVASAPIHQPWFWVLVIGVVLVFWLIMLVGRFRATPTAKANIVHTYASRCRGYALALERYPEGILHEQLLDYREAYEVMIRALAERYRIPLDERPLG